VLVLARETIAALTDKLCEATRTIDEMVENCPAVVHIKDLDARVRQFEAKNAVFRKAPHVTMRVSSRFS
jgi:hypothetical protein